MPFIAEAAFTGADPLHTLNTRDSNDLDHADHYGAGLPASSVYALLRRAERLVIHTPRDAIAAVAAALLLPPPRLTTADVAEIVDNHHPAGLGYLRRTIEDVNGQITNPRITKHSTGDPMTHPVAPAPPYLTQ